MRTLVLIALATIAAAQTLNYSGKWMIEQPGRFGRMQQSILTLNQVGTKVTGTLEAGASDSDASPVSRDILDGKVEAGVLSFYLWAGRDKPAKTFYKGTMSGESINFTVTGGVGQPGPNGTTRPPESRQLAAKRTL